MEEHCQILRKILLFCVVLNCETRAILNQVTESWNYGIVWFKRDFLKFMQLTGPFQLTQVKCQYMSRTKSCLGDTNCIHPSARCRCETVSFPPDTTRSCCKQIFNLPSDLYQPQSPAASAVCVLVLTFHFSTGNSQLFKQTL